MHLFASERIASIMDRLGFKDGERIESPMISKSIERAQKKVEENNFGIRKHLLEYDDVMNKQRTVIYEKRRHALMGERIGMDITNIIWDRVVNIIQTNDYEGCKECFLKVLAMECPFSEGEFINAQGLPSKSCKLSIRHGRLQTPHRPHQSTAYPTIKEVYETQESGRKNPCSHHRWQTRTPNPLRPRRPTTLVFIVKQFEKQSCSTSSTTAGKKIYASSTSFSDVQMLSYEQERPLLIFKLESVKTLR